MYSPLGWRPEPAFGGSIDRTIPAHCSENKNSHKQLFVKFRRLLQPGIGREVVLNPKLSTGFFQKRLDGRSGRDGLRDVEFRGRDSIELPLLRIMIKIAAQQNRAGFR